MSKGTIEERLEIRELVETFAVGTMHVDLEKWGGTWAEDGLWKLPSMEEPAVGKDNIVKAFAEKLAYVEYMSMISFPHELDFEGDTATGQCYCRELIYPKAGGKLVVVGYFNDKYVKQDGRWLFASRIYEVLGKEMQQ